MQTVKFLAILSWTVSVLTAPIPNSPSPGSPPSSGSPTSLQCGGSYLWNIAGSAEGDLSCNGNGNSAGNNNQNNGNGNGGNSGNGNGDKNNFGNGNNIGSGDNGIKIGRKRNSGSSSPPPPANSFENIAGSAIGDLSDNGKSNNAGNDSQDDGNGNGSESGDGNGNGNWFGNGNTVRSEDSGISVGRRNDALPSSAPTTEFEDIAGSAIDSLSRDGNGNSVGNGNVGNGNGNGDNSGDKVCAVSISNSNSQYLTRESERNGNWFGNGNAAGSGDSGIRVDKVRRISQSPTASYVDGIISAGASGSEGVVNAALPISSTSWWI